ncbi:MAG TPA: GDP-mannose 4,6-dehydratase [Rudaea sp.]|nr:GDP-mannose 4,6-dehydratase [Rudaea sp.]
MPRALIVGHSGQDGSLLWEQLVARGFELIGLARNAVRAHAAAWDDRVDIRDADVVRRLVDAFRPDQVYFLAAHHHSSEQPRGDDGELWRGSWDVHVHAFSHFLAAVADCCSQARIFYAASSRVFGHAETSPQDEITALRPACPYGVTKAAGMMLADYYVRERGLCVSCGILFNHESPLRSAQFVSRRVVEGLMALRDGRASRLEIGTLDACVDWGYAPDYTRAMQLLLDAPNPGHFVVASGIMHSVRDLIAIAADYLGVEWESRVVETARLLKRDPQQLCGDASRLRQATGWMPTVDFRQMVHILVDGALERARLMKG